jgi:hypothetical protein
MLKRRRNKITSREILPVLFALICIALPVISLAQAGPDDPNDVPVDGGLSLLLAAGTAYGIKKYRNYKTVIKEETE